MLRTWIFTVLSASISERAISLLQSGHVEIKQNYVRAKRLRALQTFEPIGSFADNFEIGLTLQERMNARAK